jgi:hypothetical protein
VLLAAGVPCSINCDDSLTFGATIVDEYLPTALLPYALGGCADVLMCSLFRSGFQLV